MSKGGSAPESDPRIGEAALLSVKLGDRYLDTMTKQAAISNGWADEDRKRYQGRFLPIEDQFIKDAQGWDSPERKSAAAIEASGDALMAGDQAIQQNSRRLAAMGVNPASGAAVNAGRKMALDVNLAAAGAINAGRRRVDAEGEAKIASAINMGNGMAVNPGDSLRIANGAQSEGFQGAMQGYQQQGNLLSADFNNRMQTYKAKQEQSSSLWGAAGNLMGMMMPGSPMAMLSDEDAKTNKRPVKRSLLKAIEGMRVEDWDYKDGEGDGASHTGTYAQDFQRETGKGDGRSIDVIDAIGTTMGAVKELSAKVDKMAKTAKRRRLPE